MKIMKNKKKYVVLAALLSVGFISGVSLDKKIQADAGFMYKEILSSSDFSGTAVNENEWRTEGEVALQSGALVLTAAADEGSSALYRTQLSCESVKDSFVFESRITVNQLAGEKRGGILLGAERIRYTVGDVNTTFVYVANTSNGMGVGIAAYDENGDKTELLASPVSVNTTYSMKIVGTGNSLQLFVNGSEVYNQAFEGVLGGYFGFATTEEGGDDAALSIAFSNVNVVNDYYDVPQNTNIYETFDDNSLNTGIWHLAHNAPYLAGAAEANGRWRCIDDNGSTLTTKYKYSNFDLSFDIPWVKRTTEYYDSGKVSSPACSWFGFFFGIDESDYSNISYADQILGKKNGDCYTLRINPNMVNGVPSGTTSIMFGRVLSGASKYDLPKQYDLFDLDHEGRTFQVRFSCKDDVFALEVKWADETEWYHVFTVENSMVTGYISFTSYGSGANNSVHKGNMEWDNIVITNRDYNGNVIQVEKESEDLANPGDYGYADAKDPSDLLVDGTDFDANEKSGCGSVTTGAEGILVACLIGGVALLKKRRNDQ